MIYANKRWGRGRIRQLLVRAYCRLRGHAWRTPWDGFQCCGRECGTCRSVPLTDEERRLGYERTHRFEDEFEDWG